MLATAKDGRNYSQEPPELQLVRAKCIDNTQLISCNYSCRNMGSVLLRLHFRKFPQKFASCVCISERRRRGVEADGHLEGKFGSLKSKLENVEFGGSKENAYEKAHYHFSEHEISGNTYHERQIR